MLISCNDIAYYFEIWMKKDFHICIFYSELLFGDTKLDSEHQVSNVNLLLISGGNVFKCGLNLKCSQKIKVSYYMRYWKPAWFFLLGWTWALVRCSPWKVTRDGWAILAVRSVAIRGPAPGISASGPARRPLCCSGGSRGWLDGAAGTASSWTLHAGNTTCHLQNKSLTHVYFHLV